ncbi:MAG: tyrosine-type recombinase/integrase [Candidatus Eremiobacter antarcticus]|nr:site-specific integrase [Candidatus Eremiobacteraeota bacterium]MBC5808832.1 site-specific integrase [Candidatus Eremiobacteraeota bacterium]
MSRRRSPGEGSVYQRKDGWWRGTISLGYDQTGKRRRQVVYGKTKTQVIAKLREIAPGPIAQSAYDAQRVTLEEHLTRWLASRRAHLRPTTHRSYADTIRLHIAPSLGRIPLGALTPANIEALQLRLERLGRGARTRELAHVILHAALRRAVQWHMLAFDPSQPVQRPRVQRVPPNTWSASDVISFLAAACSDRYYALYVLALTTGMRQGELIGLQRAQVDLQRGFVSIVSQHGRTGDRPTKTRSSVRRIELPAITVSTLAAHFQRVGDSVLAFPSHADTNVNPSNLVRRSFDRIVRRAGLPRIKFHDLRHTAATLLLERGVHPKVVAEMLGHSSVRITLDTYSHVSVTMQKEAAAAFDSLLRPSGDTVATVLQADLDVKNPHSLTE